MHAAALVRHRSRRPRSSTPCRICCWTSTRCLQILVNLIRNAKYALAGSTAEERRLTLGVRLNGDNLRPHLGGR